MFCPACYNGNSHNSSTESMLEEMQNFDNWIKAANVVSASKRQQRFIARKIHKLKKILKLGSKSLAKKRTLEERQNNENEIEHRQNRANEVLEYKLATELQNQQQQQQHYKYLEDEQNMVNENWENWDCCYLCANQQQPLYPPSYYSTAYTSSAARVQQQQQQQQQHSICYVFMPGEAEPVPVKLRTAKIPGGVMWISYEPDFDIRTGENLYTYTSSQIPQGQRAILV